MDLQQLTNIASVPVIIGATYFIIDLIKKATDNNPKFLRMIPLCSAAIGAVIGAIMFKVEPSLISAADSVTTAIIIGAASGLAATGSNQIKKQLTKDATKTPTIDETPQDDKTVKGNGN